MFYYQESKNASTVAKCDREAFWKAVKSQQTQWHIDARRAVIAAVRADQDGEGVAAIHNWLQNTDYQKFLLRYPTLLKTKEAREAFAAKSDEEKLLAWADELKGELTAFIFCCYLFDLSEKKSKKKDVKPIKVCRRKLQACHVNGLVMLDIDHVENPMQIWYKLRDMKELMDRVVLVHITTSGDGLRIIFTADIKQGNLADNQIEFAQALGQKPDASCIDATRISYCPKENEILYIDEERLFEHYDKKFDKKFTPEYQKGKTQPINHESIASDGNHHHSHTKASAVASENAQQGTETVSPVDDQKNVKWRGYDIQGIIDARYGDKLPCRDDSNRHTESLKLATDLLIMLDGDRQLVRQIVEAQPWVREIIEERDEDVDQTVESAADCVSQKEKKSPRPLPSKAMMEAVEKATGTPFRTIISDQHRLAPPVLGGDIELKLQQWGEEIEGMFDDFPLLRDICAGLKPNQYPAALFVAGGTLMTDMTRTWYRFYHRPQQERRLNACLFIIGHPASNKSMADDIYEILSAPIAAADKAGKAALNRYKQETKKKAANKEGKDKPQGIIRIHPARTSNGQMIQDMLNAHEVIDGKDMQLHLLTFDTELDNATTLQTGGSWINKMSMELKAFHNEKDGQMYQNSDSPVDEFYVTWNYIYTGTPIALKRKVNERNFGSGLSTRLAVIPVPKTNCDMIEFEEKERIDWQRLDRMKTWAFRLDRRFGELPLWGLVRKIYDWTANRMADCKEDDIDEANELMLKRVPYHALNYAAPFIDMRHWGSLHQENGYWTGEYETDETDWKLCELIARIQYATQQHFFGVMAEKYFEDMNSDVQIIGKRHQQKSVEGFNRLPEVFTKEDVKRCFCIDKDNSAYKKIKRLTFERQIEMIEEGEEKGKFRKLKQNIY